MFLKPTRKTVRGKTYTNHLLVESITTPAGPRHRTICSLGSLEPAPREHWLALAQKLGAGLNQRARLPTEVMTINRPAAPASEHAMPERAPRTGALSGPGRTVNRW